MIKIEHSTLGFDGLARKLRYIAGLGEYTEKAVTDKVTRALDIDNLDKVQLFLEKYGLALEPQGKGRRSKRTAIEMVMSWLQPATGKEHEILEAFMEKHFKGHLWTWAHHNDVNDKGDAVNHYHLLICPRHEDGQITRIGQKEIAEMQKTFQVESGSRGLKTGWKIKRGRADEDGRLKRKRRRKPKEYAAAEIKQRAQKAQKPLSVGNPSGKSKKRGRDEIRGPKR